jgi:hypothetical protein
MKNYTTCLPYRLEHVQTVVVSKGHVNTSLLTQKQFVNRGERSTYSILVWNLKLFGLLV